MTYCEAANRIEEHMHHHYNKEGERCSKITEALSLAIETMRLLSYLQFGGTLVFQSDTIDHFEHKELP